MKQVTVLLVVCALLLAACNAAPTPAAEPYPAAPAAATAVSSSAYPAGGAAQAIVIAGPQAGDENLTRGEVFLDTLNIVAQESTPGQYVLQVSGSLPTPCNQVRGVAAAPDANHKVVVELYSVADPNQMCTQVLQAFTGTLTLGTFTTGSYPVEVNGQVIGQIDVP